MWETDFKSIITGGTEQQREELIVKWEWNGIT